MKGPWLTRPYDVRLSDGSKRSVYAQTPREAEERMARHLVRHASPLRVREEDALTIDVVLTMSEYRLLQEASPREDVADVWRTALPHKKGRWHYRLVRFPSLDTAEEATFHYEEIADCVGDMTAAEREGGREHIVARSAAQKIRSVAGLSA